MRRWSGRSDLQRAWLVAVCTIAAAQMALGLAGMVAVAAGSEPYFESSISLWQRSVAALTFAGLAAYLLQGGRRDVRVAHLGVLLLLFGAFFALPPTGTIAAAAPEPLAGGVRLLRRLPMDAFTPALVWIFFRDFPRTLDRPGTARLFRVAIAVSLAAAGFLIAANFRIALRGEAGTGGTFDRFHDVSQYWTVVFGLIAPALPVALWRTRHAPPDERRRVGFFVAGLATAALLPVLLAAVPPLSPALETFLRREPVARVVLPLNLAMILSLAAITAYAVLVQHVLDVRTVLRKAARYTLAQGVVGALTLVPFALLGTVVYRGRHEPLANLFEGTLLLRLLTLLGAGLVVLRLRRRLLLAIDRLFFREAYDARRILADMAERSRSAESSEELARSLIAEVDHALHLESLGLLVSAPERGTYLPVSGTVRRLDASSALIQLLAKDGKPLRVDLARHAPPLQQLSEDDLVWIADAGAEVLVPLVGSRRSITGILSLGPKRSELPFSREDMLLLAALGGAAGIGLENRQLQESVGADRLRSSEEQRAAECARCGRVVAPEASCCTACGGRVRGCPLPQELFGKFHLERRIGSGGMGVVYRATDVALGRPVALKTLPSTRPADAARLRREARAMAAITHLNLAVIFGAETWQGTPILVIEYLAGQTLTERLAAGPLAAGEALDLCATLADALQFLHDSGYLHRDVKPSNIGFTDAGVPKLLDFGLVRIAGRESGSSASQGAREGGLTESGLLGTPLYMSPEALAGERPDPSFDLWSLGVVGFEAIAGCHPFEREHAGETLTAIQHGLAVDLAEIRPGCPPEVAALFGRLLASDRSARPPSARVMARLLREARSAIAPGGPIAPAAPLH